MMVEKDKGGRVVTRLAAIGVSDIEVEKDGKLSYVSKLKEACSRPKQRMLLIWSLRSRFLSELYMKTPAADQNANTRTKDAGSLASPKVWESAFLSTGPRECQVY